MQLASSRCGLPTAPSRNHVAHSQPGFDITAFSASFLQVGNIFYFAGTDDSKGSELWRTDGTVAGTYVLRDIAVGLPMLSLQTSVT